MQFVQQALYEVHGFDFRDYSPASLKRRLEYCTQKEKLNHISELIPKILHEEGFAQRLVNGLSINVTQMFRDVSFFQALKNDIFPLLRTFPFFKIWHAGCSSGEEVYSLAILLQEEDLLSRAQIYGTDMNHAVLKRAKEGIYPMNQIKEGEERYLASGGKRSLSDYFTTRYGSTRINSSLKERITFANHNLASDSRFAEVQLVICRNVLIYFNKHLKTQVVQLFYDSLYPGGALCLGNKENLTLLPIGQRFLPLNDHERIYKKTVEGQAS